MSRVAFAAFGLAGSLLAGCSASSIENTPYELSMDDGRRVRVNFEGDDVDHPPHDFSVHLAGDGPPPDWRVIADPNAHDGTKVLAQLGQSMEGFRFPLCIYEPLVAKDVAVNVRFKGVAGTQNRSGGIVLRYTDPSHFYVARFNCLEANIFMYVYLVEGKRTQLVGAKHLPLIEDVWHRLKFEAVGSRFRVWFNDQLRFEFEDTSIATAGRVGLWTKTDSVTYFDDMLIENLDPTTGTKSAAATPSSTLTFDDVPIGSLPQGLTAFDLKTGEPASWFVADDRSAPRGTHVLDQRPTPNDGTRRASACLVENSSCEDVDVEVSFKADQSLVDEKSGGILARFADRDNYVLARVNTAEDNIYLYRVAAGKQTKLVSITHQPYTEGEWHRLRLELIGDRARVWCDGRLVIDANDEALLGRGKVGVRVPGTGRTQYDDLKIVPLSTKP